MGLTKEQAAGYRQSCILNVLKETGGVTSGSLASKFGVRRGTIINDIAALRKKGYPIQATSMRTEGGIYQAAFELITIPENTSAVRAAQRSQNANTGGRPADRPAGGYAQNAAGSANSMSAGQGSGNACTNRRR